jgi:hypothetical protein
MSKLEVDAIEPQSGTTLTLGASGDTVTVASGASFASIGIDDNATSTAITIDSSENVGIGTAIPTTKLDVAGSILLSSGANNSITINRTTALSGWNITMGQNGQNPYITGNDARDFDINVDPDNTTSDSLFRINVDGSERMKIDTSGNVKIANGIVYGGGGGISMSTSRLLPTGSTGTTNDDVNDCGGPSNRWDDIYATSGTVNTSDQNEKQSIQSLTTAEMNVAKRLSSLIKTFKWNSSVEEKGDSARTHAGIIAQDVEQAFADEGLNASNYGLWCSDTWWEKEISVDAVQAQEATYDEEGNELTPAIEAVEAKDAYTYIDTKEEATEGYTEKTRLGVRYPELLSFIQAYNDQRFTALEARITALENK